MQMRQMKMHDATYAYLNDRLINKGTRWLRYTIQISTPIRDHRRTIYIQIFSTSEVSKCKNIFHFSLQRFMTLLVRKDRCKSIYSLPNFTSFHRNPRPIYYPKTFQILRITVGFPGAWFMTFTKGAKLSTHTDKGKHTAIITVATTTAIALDFQ